MVSIFGSWSCRDNDMGRRIYGFQNALRGNIFQSFMCNANDCVLIIKICCSMEARAITIVQSPTIYSYTDTA